VKKKLMRWLVSLKVGEDVDEVAGQPAG